jgi:hypothetical protein
MEHILKVILKRIIMKKENLHLKMEDIIQENGLIIEWKEKVNLLGKKIYIIKVSIRII